MAALLPWYWAGVAIGALIPMYHIPNRAFPYLFLMAGNLYVATHGWQLGLVGHLWSLSVEEQFYLLVPALTKAGGRRALVSASCACLPVTYATLAFLAFRHTNPHLGVWVNSFVQFQFFAAGTLIAVLLHSKMWAASWVTRAALLLGGSIGLVLTARVFHTGSNDPLPFYALWACYLTGLISCVAIFFAFLNMRTSIPKPLLYLGRISFGLYVFHVFALTFTLNLPEWMPSLHFNTRENMLGVAGAMALTIGLASASFHLFERKILRLKEHFAYVKSGAEIAAPQR